MFCRYHPFAVDDVFDFPFPSSLLCRRRNDYPPLALLTGGVEKEQKQEKALQLKKPTKFEASLDVSDYRPDELRISLEGRELKIEGHHKKSNEDGSYFRHFTRSLVLPSTVDDRTVRCALEDGRLSIEAKQKTQKRRKQRRLAVKVKEQEQREQSSNSSSSSPLRPRTPDGSLEPLDKY